MKKIALYALTFILLFQTLHAEEKTAATIIGKGLLTTACFGAAAATPYLISASYSKGSKKILPKVCLAYSFFPLIYATYAINKPDNGYAQKPPIKSYPSAFLKFGLCGLNVLDAIALMLCTKDHLQKGKKYKAVDDWGIAHHLVAIPVLLGTAYELYISGRQSLPSSLPNEALASSVQANKEQK